MGVAIQLWQYVLCATGNSIICEIWWWYGTSHHGRALKYEGWRYVYGGASPTSSFDCSGLTQWTYGKAGINFHTSRTTAIWYDQHIPLSKHKLAIWFSFILPITLALGRIYLGNNRMFHAGDPIGYADLTNYWQQHLVGAGPSNNEREGLMMKFRKIRIKRKQIPRKKLINHL